MKYLTILAIALLTTGCTTGNLPMPAGEFVRINSLDTAERLTHEQGYMLVGPDRETERIRRHFLLNPSRKLLREPDPAILTRLGADLVNRVVTVGFDYASADFNPSGAQKFHLMQLLAVADRVEIRGRTDGPVSDRVNARMAYRRADAAKRYLLDRNVPASVIAMNVVGAGDHVADNESTTGRALNRRVEIEFYLDGQSL